MDTISPGTTGRKAVFSIDEFCRSHDISRAMFYKLLKENKAPRIMCVGARRLISDEAAVEWRRAMEAIAA
jgi:predicted DNA-binding transcriptional regulator AlpA